MTWEEATMDAYHWFRSHKAGQFGQIILEDHRDHYQNPGKLWVHVSIPSPKHPGKEDINAMLISHAPGHYMTFDPQSENRA
jgi:hypothetical protein